MSPIVDMTGTGYLNFQTDPLPKRDEACGIKKWLRNQGGKEKKDRPGLAIIN